MDCPNCKIKMNPVKTESHYGAKIVLDQCLQCGGTWFDNSEPFEVKHGGADKLSNLDSQKLSENSIINNMDLVCPRDKTKLSLFEDANFPKSIIVDHCKKCGGFWFNRGEFNAFQDNKRRKQTNKKTTKDTNLSNQIEQMLAMHSTQDKYKPLKQLGDYLSTPVNPYSKHLFVDDKYKEPTKKVLATVETIGAGIVVAIQLLRIVSNFLH
ncbi:MAG: zf-TFIIB domain-containing protein [bacterium]|nr:zf-TFIIB domain-containing protein [bacterium]